MLKYIGKRLLLFIPTIFIISVVIFFIIQLPPGDYATSYAAAMAAEGEIMTPEQIQELRMQFGCRGLPGTGPRGPAPESSNYVLERITGSYSWIYQHWQRAIPMSR